MHDLSFQKNNMYILLILFFISLLGIVFMIGRKLVLIQNRQSLNEIPAEEDRQFEIHPYIKEVKYITIKNIKKYGHISLVETLRFYIRSSNFLKNKYEEIKIKNIQYRNRLASDLPEKQVSKFLKMISDYKHKIREIKHKIHEEERNL